MKIRYQNEPFLKEDYVEIHYQEESEKIKAIRTFFDEFRSIIGKKENEIYKLYPESIYYLEVVGRKLFAYQEKEVYRLEYSIQHFWNVLKIAALYEWVNQLLSTFIKLIG